MEKTTLHSKVLYPVVRIFTDKAIGSGTLLYSKKGKDEDFTTYVLTNNHVISDLITYKKEWDPVLQRDMKREIKSAASVQEFRYKSGRTLVMGESSVQGDVVGYDVRQDLALIKLRDIKEYPNVSEMWPKDMPLDMLMELYCVGCGLGQKPLMTCGHLSGMGIEIENYDYMLSTAASIFGNSGGAVFSVETLQFVGIPSRIAVSMMGYQAITHMGYFIPVTRVYNFLDDQCYQFIYDSNYTPEKCEKLREEKRERELAEYKSKVVCGAESEYEEEK